MEEYQHLHELAYHACAALTAELAPKRVFVASLGSSKALAQSFPHFHIHVVPVFAEDERARPAHVLSWSSGVTIYDTQQATALTRRLAHAFHSNRGETRMATHTISSVNQVQSALREEAQLSVQGDAERRSRGLRRWFAAALSLVARARVAQAIPTRTCHPRKRRQPRRRSKFFGANQSSSIERSASYSAEIRVRLVA